MDKSVLQIFNKEKSCLGTGFVIDSDQDGVYVVTCGHVVNNCKNDILVEDVDAEIMQNHYENDLDLAILYVKGLVKIPFFLSSEKSAKTTKVIGYSMFQGVPKREPINNVEVKYDIQISKEKLNIEAIKLYPKEPISNGYSGSPVICQNSNKVIGIVNLQVGKDTNYAISAKHILDIYDIKGSVNIPSTIQHKKGLTSTLKVEDYIFIKKQFDQNLTEALESFSTQPQVWIEPLVHTISEDSNVSSDKETKISLEDILNKPRCLTIQARQQFGLTCLGHYLVKEAWADEKPSFWLFIDINDLKANTKEIEKHILKKLKNLGLAIEDLECVVLDEFSSDIQNASEILNKLNDFLKNIPLIVLITIVETSLLNDNIELPQNRIFENLYLWALPRNSVRQVVVEYNDKKYIGNENDVVDKVISDLDVLNIPRTPLNCLTLLKISEIDFDDSPVNRTEMIRRVLFLLFNIDDIPKYKSRPDLKDTEYILGYFCELMLREKKYSFTREYFLEVLNNFCKSNEIDLDIHVIFDILFKNHILIMRGTNFCFKFTYWILYFAAHRMHHSTDFSTYILQDTRYSSYPELIEFYTGIDRRRDDALQILIKDIKTIKKQVEEKCGLPSDFNIYDTAQWNPAEDDIKKMQSEITDGVLHSNLPLTVKDQYADQSYNKLRPLTQSINSILEEYSLLRLMKILQASAKALRNSDYSSLEMKHELLQEIMNGWEQISKVIIILSPILAQQQSASFQGVSIYLSGNFADSEARRFNQILESIPQSMVIQYKDDLFSKKMGSLLYNHIKKETNQLIKHSLNLLLIQKRPKGWEKYIEEYIVSENKNSFYLNGVYIRLRTEYKYSITSKSTLNSLENLIRMTVAKHELGLTKPTQKAIRTIDKKYRNIIPKRNDID